MILSIWIKTGNIGRIRRKQCCCGWIICFFADRALNRFLAPFRGKVTCPAYYFGTMDLSCLVYSGEAAPWGREDKVMQYAFDEKML